MAEDQAQRTEAATPKRREDARRKGQVAQSRDVSTVLLLMAAAFALSSPLGVDLSATVFETARTIWGGSLIVPDSVEDFHASS